MNTRLTTILGVATLLAGGCADVATAPATRAEPHPATPPTPATATAIAGSSGLAPPTHGDQRVTRTIDEDADGDGIAERRVIITEIYDDAGMLLERVREQDFQADGIVDLRTVTRFDGSTGPNM